MRKFKIGDRVKLRDIDANRGLRISGYNARGLTFIVIKYFWSNCTRNYRLTYRGVYVGTFAEARLEGVGGKTKNHPLTTIFQ